VCDTIQTFRPRIRGKEKGEMAGLEDVIETLKEFNQLREHSIRLREGGARYLAKAGKARRDDKTGAGNSSPALDLIGDATFSQD
jgi:hypothetical protein